MKKPEKIIRLGFWIGVAPAMCAIVLRPKGTTMHLPRFQKSTHLCPSGNSRFGSAVSSMRGTSRQT